MKKRKLQWDAAASAAANARIRLPALARAYFLQGRKLAEADAPPPSALHRFRLDTKAFRYTLELFRPCYGPGLDSRLAALRNIQDLLGAISDYATTRGLIASRLPKEAPERLRMERYLDGRSKRKAAEFRRYWRTVFDGHGEGESWPRYLSRPRVARAL